MSAFDSSTNTGSTTFTNSWGTVELLPSGSVQKASGFIRTTGWRYYEMKIEDQGGDNKRLFVGGGIPNFGGGLGPNTLWGGTSKQGNADTGVFVPAYPYDITAAFASLTACTGDVFMFSVDMTGGGRDHLGVQRVLTTSDGSGGILYPFFMEVGKNGVWPDIGIAAFSWPAHGYPMQLVPWAVRDSTSAATAKVSLRVETTSFAYPIPTGMVAFGDGPEGGVSPTVTYTVAWDPSRRFGGVLDTAALMTMTDSNYIVQVSRTSFAEYVWIQSTPLPTIADGLGPRAIEFRWNSGNILHFNLIDQNKTTSLTYTKSEQIHFFTNIYRHGVIATSVTGGSYSPDSTQQNPVQQYIVNHTTGRIWGADGGNNAQDGCWFGTAGASRATPYGEVDGFTITDSLGWRWMAAMFPSASLSFVEINSGRRAFMAYPLMPGVISLDGSRQVYGVGDTWKTGISSLSYTHSNLGALKMGSLVGYLESSGSRNSGKVFAQVWTPSFVGVTGATSMSVVVGLRQATETKLSESVGLATKNNLVFELGSTASRVSINSITAACTISITSTNIANWQMCWYSIAADFDVGRIWLGVLDTRFRQNIYANGGDPVAGTGGFTFTAGTAMRVFSHLSSVYSTKLKPMILVAETNNVVDMPAGFVAWNGSGPEASLTATPSAAVPTTTVSGGLRVLWPYGVQT